VALILRASPSQESFPPPSFPTKSNSSLYEVDSVAVIVCVAVIVTKVGDVATLEVPLVVSIAVALVVVDSGRGVEEEFPMLN
jgi:hypothetical protein